MKKLTKRQKDFCYFVVLGDSVQVSAAKSGYAKGESGSVNGYKALKIPGIQTEIKKQVQENMLLSSVKATRVLEDLSLNAKSEYVRFSSADSIVNRVFPKQETTLNLSGNDMKVLIDLG